MHLVKIPFGKGISQWKRVADGGRRNRPHLMPSPDRIGHYAKWKKKGYKMPIYIYQTTNDNSGAEK